MALTDVQRGVKENLSSIRILFGVLFGSAALCFLGGILFPPSGMNEYGPVGKIVALFSLPAFSLAFLFKIFTISALVDMVRVKIGLILALGQLIGILTGVLFFLPVFFDSSVGEEPPCSYFVWFISVFLWDLVSYKMLTRPEEISVLRDSNEIPC